MNNIHSINWKIIYRELPPVKQHSDDRVPTLEEIKKLIDFYDRRIKVIVLTMISSGIRVGAWDHLKWKHVVPIQRRDTVSVIVICSLSPIPIDLFGLVLLSSSLTRIEDRLQLLVNDYNNTIFQSGQKQQYLSLILNSKIPNHTSWMVKMWHFGRDALVEYSGEKFNFT